MDRIHCRRLKKMKPFRTSILSSIVLAMAVFSTGLIHGQDSNAAPEEKLVGEWEGTINAGPNKTLGVVWLFEILEVGELVGFMGPASRGAATIPMSNIVITDTEVSFDVPSQNGKFKGSFSDSDIAGTWTQGSSVTGSLIMAPKKEREAKPHFAPRKAVYAPNGVISTSHPLASQAGLSVLERGGNAVDAAVTAAVVLNVVEPFATGLGGDLFSILWSAEEQRLIGLNASGRSGSLMTLEEMLSRGHKRVPRIGAETITVPGALSGWSALLEEHGTITLAEAFAPAIALAEEGFPVSNHLAKEWAVFASEIRKDPEGRSTFLVDNRRAPRAGEWHSNPEFAETLRTIAKEGTETFYGGAMGRRIAEHVQKLDGFLALEDFADHKAEWVVPMSVPFKNYRVWEMPPNGQGIAVLEMLRILEPFDLAAMGHNSAAYFHHLIEAKKLAFADLQHFVGDPRTMAINPDELLTDEFIARRRNLIDSDRAIRRADPDSTLSTSNTTYLTVADSDGNMISLINSLAGGFGSGVVVPGTGFALQNRGVGFSFEKGRANTVGPKRRPYHTIIPGFVTKTDADGNYEPWLSFGIVGGYQQPQAHVQVLMNIIVFDMDVQQALDAARFHHYDAHYVSLESSIPRSVIAELKAMGHLALDPQPDTPGGFEFGGGQAIMRNQRGYVAGSDPRRDGLAAAH
jgi:gamma-glutamyltranspeptidase/glutathione hydrolase